MKKYIIISTILIISIILILVLTSSKTPFESLSILNENISTTKKDTKYNIKIDCTNLPEPNEQIINYKLKKKYQDTPVSVSTTIYDSHNNIISDYEDFAYMTTEIIVKDFTYIINTECK